MLSAVRAGRLCSPGNIPDTRFCQRRTRPHGHSAAGRIKTMKSPIGNGTRDLPACSAVPQATTTPRNPPPPSQRKERYRKVL